MEVFVLEEVKLVFGPVPSRRLGRSLGINNIPAKTCSYSCVYCQVGKTSDMTVKRKRFYNPEDIFEEVKRKINELTLKGETVNYLTFVPDGEPTLDLNLGREILLLKEMNIPIAVLTNASLLRLDNVKEDLLNVDYVSLKIDTVSENLWKKINRPHKTLKLNVILDSITEFTKQFEGILVSETMLIDDVNHEDDLEKVAGFLKGLKKLEKAYIAVPTRPPTEKWVRSPKEEAVNAAFQIFSEHLGFNRVECLIGYEGNAFSFTGEVVNDLLSITAVHPMRRDAVKEFLRKAGEDWAVIKNLLCEGKLVKLHYRGKTYYLCRLSNKT